MKKIIILGIIILNIIQLNAQLTITTNQSPVQLAIALFGNQGQVSNITVNCAQNAYAGFSNGLSSGLGIDNGILLTSGNAQWINSPASSFSNAINNTPGDANLTSLVGVNTYDACVVEFDFIPYCSQLQGRIVFGSEEYPEWVFTSYNDGCAILLSGPNPLGGSYTNKNLITVPPTLPVCINAVNSSQNSVYYINNSANAFVAYDGITIPININVSVVPCAGYRVKIVVADASDWVYDSGIFIERTTAQCAIAPVITVYHDTTICEGQSVMLWATGAQNYTWNPGNITGSPIIVSPTTTTTYTVTGWNSCYSQLSGIGFTTITVLPAPTIVIYPQNPEITVGDLITLIASGGINYQWSTGDSLSQITVSPEEDSLYSVIGFSVDGCIGYASTKVIVSGPLFIPNAFTPNGDGLNNEFLIKGYHLERYRIFIYNRWGEIIYKTDNLNNTWDGRDCQEDTYVYLIENKKTGKQYKGCVTLIR